MTRADVAMYPAERAWDAHRGFSVAVDQMRQGEQVVALINPGAREVDYAASSTWLSARLSIGELPRVLLPHCDARCEDEAHDPNDFVVLADLALDETTLRRTSWWESWTDSLQRDLRGARLWYAGSPALVDTPPSRQLRTGTRLTRVAATDPYWVHYDTVEQETLYRIDSGPHEGEAMIVASFGLSPLLPGLAGALIAPNHAPARDVGVAIRLLTAGWAAVERGLPFEE